MFFRDFKDGKIPDWVEVRMRHSVKYKHIFGLVNIVLALPPSSAEAERGFSQLKLIKTPMRSSMSQNLLNNYMTVKMLSNSSTFCPSEAIHLWNQTGVRPRRPFVMDRAATSGGSGLTVTGASGGPVDLTPSPPATATVPETHIDLTEDLTEESPSDSDSESDIDEADIFENLLNI